MAAGTAQMLAAQVARSLLVYETGEPAAGHLTRHGRQQPYMASCVAPLYLRLPTEDAGAEPRNGLEDVSEWQSPQWNHSH